MTGKTILVVEDSPTELEMIRTALEGRGYDIVTASDGEQALEKVNALKPDLVLLDVILPKKNGFEICRTLKTSHQTADIKVVLVSGKNQQSDRFWGMKQGADDYLTKPFCDEDLTSVVARYV